MHKILYVILIFILKYCLEWLWCLLEHVFFLFTVGASARGRGGGRGRRGGGRDRREKVAESSSDDESAQVDLTGASPGDSEGKSNLLCWKWNA